MLSWYSWNNVAQENVFPDSKKRGTRESLYNSGNFVWTTVDHSVYIWIYLVFHFKNNEVILPLQQLYILPSKWSNFLSDAI